MIPLQTQVQQQKQSLSLRQQQSLKILQLPLPALQSYLAELLLENPLAELDTGATDMVSIEDAQEAAFLQEGDIRHPEEPSVSDFSGKQTVPETLQEHLLKQLRQDRRLPAEYLDRCCFLVESLNTRGYLDEPISLLAEAMGISEEDALQALYAVQSLTPAGVGARDLSECLTLQLVQTKYFNGYTLKIICCHLPLLARKNYRAIAKALRIPEKEARHWCEVVQQLNPIPGQGFAETAMERYIVPEAQISLENGQLTIHRSQQAVPWVRRCSDYDHLSGSSDPALREYLHRNEVQLAELQADLELREATIFQILRCVTELQRAYITGDTPSPLPLAIRDVAVQLSLHPSTVSRAVQGKYITCPIGTIPLRSLFTPAVGGTFSAGRKTVLDQLRRLIAAEDQEHPLSDETLRSELNALGISLSRRSIAAYRKELAIPPAYVRRNRK